MTTIRPLPVHPYPVAPADEQLIRAAKAALNLDIQVELCPAAPGAGRILALRERPPFVCLCAPVPDPTKPGSLEAAIRWVLGEGPDELGYTQADYLKDLIGATEVKYGEFYG